MDIIKSTTPAYAAKIIKSTVCAHCRQVACVWQLNGPIIKRKVNFMIDLTYNDRTKMNPFKNYYNDNYKRALLKSTAKFVSQAGFAVPSARFELPTCVLEGITNILNPTQQIE